MQNSQESGHIKLLLIIPVALLLLVGSVYLYANYRVKNLVDSRIDEYLASGSYQEIAYETVNLELDGDFSMRNLHVVDSSGNEYILENIHVANYDYFNPFPRSMDVTATGLRLPVGIPAFGNTPNQALNNYLEGIMEDDFLPLEMHYRYQYLPEENFRLDSAFSIGLPGSFHLTTDSEMRNVPLEDINSNPAMGINTSQYSLLVQDADIPSANIALQDLGLVDAFMAIQAETLGIPSDQYRQQLLAQLQTMVLFAPQQLQSLAGDFMEKFTDFLGGGKTLSLSITPEYGGNIQQLQGEILGAFYTGNFSRINELLNLKIETL